jgi:two-component system chemotaxis response regulator CheY
MNVLIVDDSRANRMVVKNYLADLGFQVTETPDGSEGLRSLKGGAKFDLLLVSWNLPGMNGLDFIRNVRSDANLNAVPILLMGEGNTHQHLVDAVEAGASEYLMRPFTKPVLATKLDILGLEHR